MTIDSGSLDYPLPAFAFLVQVGATAGSDAAFRDVSGIGAEMALDADLVEGGENRFVYKLPRGAKQGLLSLKRGIVPKASPLITWCTAVFEQGLDVPVLLQPVTVTLVDAEWMPARSWVFQNAYPVKWSLDALGATKNEVAVETIELCYQTMTHLNLRS